MHLICFHYGRYGHRAEDCCEPHGSVGQIPVAIAVDGEVAVNMQEEKNLEEKDKPDLVEGDQEVNNPDNQQKDIAPDKQQKNTVPKDVAPCFGPWMLVKRPPRPKPGNNDRGRSARISHAPDQDAIFA